MCVLEGARVNDLEGLGESEEVLLSALREVVRRRRQKAKSLVRALEVGVKLI
jgi:hypothetical protein